MFGHRNNGDRKNYRITSNTMKFRNKIMIIHCTAEFTESLRDKTELHLDFLDHWSEVENDFFLNSPSNDFPQGFQIRVISQNWLSYLWLKNSNLYSCNYCRKLKIIYDSTTVRYCTLESTDFIAFSSFQLRKGFKVSRIKKGEIERGKEVKRATKF